MDVGAQGRKDEVVGRRVEAVSNKVRMTGILSSVALVLGLVAACGSTSSAAPKPVITASPADYTVVGKRHVGTTYSVQFILLGQTREIAYPTGDRRCYDAATVGQMLPVESPPGPRYDPNWKPMQPTRDSVGNAVMSDAYWQSLNQEQINKAEAPVKCR